MRVFSPHEFPTIKQESVNSTIVLMHKFTFEESTLGISNSPVFVLLGTRASDLQKL